MKWLLDVLFAGRIRREAERYARNIAFAPARASSAQARQALRAIADGTGGKIFLGETPTGDPVEADLAQIVRAYGLVTGGTGSGKSMFALLIFDGLLQRIASGEDFGCGILDAKGDLFFGALWLLERHVSELAAKDPEAAERLRRRIVICDFAGRDPVSSYNILARWPGAEADFFAWNRSDLLLDLLPGSDKLSLSATAVLQKLLLLLSEFQLPITHLDGLISDDAFRARLLAKTRNRSLRIWFSRQFPNTSKPTLSALRRRAEAFLASESVRLSLAGTSAPDFRQLQDEGRIVLINCFGSNIARSVRRLLQALVLSDIRQAVFAREQRGRPFLWICDEAQNFFLTEKLRDNMADLLTMSRSFGSFFLYLTQNMTTAVQDPRMLKILHTNIRWSFSMRGDPADCAFLKSAFPTTGRTRKPKVSPFDSIEFHSQAEERSQMLEAVSRLPDREGWLWFKAITPEALRIRTGNLSMPNGPDLESAVTEWRNDPCVGLRMSRDEYQEAITQRDREWIEDFPVETSTLLKDAYRKIRGTPS